MKSELEKLQMSLKESWSRETCFPTDQKTWSEQKPGFGQCGVTALVVWYFFGGEILERKHKSGRAFYNRLLDGTIVDLTGQNCDQVDGPERVRDPHELLRRHTKERFLQLLQSLSARGFLVE